MHRRRTEILIALFLAATTLAVFGHVLQNGFVNYDDDLYVTENPHLQAGLTGGSLVWALTTTAYANWHPLTLLSFQLDYQLFGLRPWGFHLTSLLLHVANTALLFLILNCCTTAIWRSAFVAALFAWHPLHVESVAWVAERKDVLSTLFWMLTLGSYVSYVKRPARWRYGLVMLTLALGLMAKPMLVTLPCVLLLFDFWPLGRLSSAGAGTSHASPYVKKQQEPWAAGLPLKSLLVEKIPLLVLAGASSAMTLIAQHLQPQEQAHWQDLPIRVENALVSYVVYAVKAFWPQNLSPFYPFPRHHYPLWQVAGAGILIAGVSFLTIRWRTRWPYYLVGWLWYLGTLFPVIGIVPIVGGHGMADRYTYVPLIGLFIVVVWGFADFVGRWRLNAIALPLAGAVLFLLMLNSWLQACYWHDSRSLWEHALHASPENSLAHNNLGVAWEQEGRPEEAVGHYEAALRLDPRYAVAHNNLGAALEKLGSRERAIAHNGAALRLAPSVANHMNLARLCLEDGNWDEVVQHYHAALEMAPDNPTVCFYLGQAFALKEQWKKARTYLRRAVNLQPGLARNRCALAYVLHKQGQSDAAREEYAEASRLDRHWPQAANSAAWLLATSPDPRERNGPRALELALMVCQATADQEPEFLDTLAAAYAEIGRFKDAVATARKAVELSNGSPALAQQVRVRLKLYENGKPFREDQGTSLR
jgi:tetratricopeptide (TPR) repeat protein